jgi:hypothetical protein
MLDDVVGDDDSEAGIVERRGEVADLQEAAAVLDHASIDDVHGGNRTLRPNCA